MTSDCRKERIRKAQAVNQILSLNLSSNSELNKIINNISPSSLGIINLIMLMPTSC